MDRLKHIIKDMSKNPPYGLFFPPRVIHKAS